MNSEGLKDIGNVGFNIHLGKVIIPLGHLSEELRNFSPPEDVEDKITEHIHVLVISDVYAFQGTQVAWHCCFRRVNNEANLRGNPDTLLEEPVVGVSGDVMYKVGEWCAVSGRRGDICDWWRDFDIGYIKHILDCLLESTCNFLCDISGVVAMHERLYK